MKTMLEKSSIYNVPPIIKTIPKWAYFSIYLLSIIIENASRLFGFSTPLTSELVKISFAYRYFDSSKARKDLHWHPETDIETAISEAINYYKSNSS